MLLVETYLVSHVMGDESSSGQLESGGWEQHGGLAQPLQSSSCIMAELAHSAAAEVGPFRTWPMPPEWLGRMRFARSDRTLCQHTWPLAPRSLNFREAVPVPGQSVAPLRLAAAPLWHVTSRSGVSQRPSCLYHTRPRAHHWHQMQERFEVIAPMRGGDVRGTRTTARALSHQTSHVRQRFPVHAARSHWMTADSRSRIPWSRRDPTAWSSGIECASHSSALATVRCGGPAGTRSGRCGRSERCSAPLLGLSGRFRPGGRPSVVSEELVPLLSASTAGYRQCQPIHNRHVASCSAWIRPHQASAPRCVTRSADRALIQYLEVCKAWLSPVRGTAESRKRGRLSALLAASHLWHTFLAMRHQLRRRGTVEWEGGLRLGIRGVRDAAGATEQCALVAHPAGQEGLGIVLDPLVKQGSDLSAQVSGVIESRQLITLKRSDRGVVKEVPRRLASSVGHSCVFRQRMLPSHIAHSDRLNRAVEIINVIAMGGTLVTQRS